MEVTPYVFWCRRCGANQGRHTNATWLNMFRYFIHDRGRPRPAQGVDTILLCDHHRDYELGQDQHIRADFQDLGWWSIYLPIWQPTAVTNKQLMALELMMLELARWR